MPNRITQIIVADTRIEPVVAEVRLSVFPERLTHTTEVRGRLVGPKCAYATTVEVAYPIRTWSLAERPEGLPYLTLSVIIPEPSLWEPETPFLYEGPIELWENGQLCDKASVRHGLRDLRLGPGGVRLNGRPFPVQGVACADCPAEEAAPRRADGFNTLLTPDLSADPDVLTDADRLGFLVLARVGGPVDAYYPLNLALSGHPSTLGWVLTEEALGHDSLVVAAKILSSFDGESRLGVELESPRAALPEGISFIVCTRELLPALNRHYLPRIVRTPDRPNGGPEWTSLLAAPGVLGWVWEPPAW
jgi:hypothetical protein